MNRKRIYQLLEELPLSNQAERDYFELHKGRYAMTLEQLSLRDVQEAVFADLGTLPCHLPLTLLKLGARKAIGIDYDPDRFKGQKRLEKLGMELHKADLQTDKLPLKDASMDIVLCNEVIEHFNTGTDFAVSEMLRVLKNDGILLITTPNRTNLANRVRKLLRQEINVQPAGLTGKQLHQHEYTLEELTGLLVKHGFSIEKSGYIPGSEWALVHNTFGTRLPRFIGTAYAAIPYTSPKLRSYIWVKARKK